MKKCGVILRHTIFGSSELQLHELFTKHNNAATTNQLTAIDTLLLRFCPLTLLLLENVEEVEKEELRVKKEIMPHLLNNVPFRTGVDVFDGVPGFYA